MQRVDHAEMRGHLTARINAEIHTSVRHAKGLDGPLITAMVEVVMNYLDNSVILLPDMIGKSRRRGQFGVHEPWPVGLEPASPP